MEVNTIFDSSDIANDRTRKYKRLKFVKRTQRLTHFLNVINQAHTDISIHQPILNRDPRDFQKKKQQELFTNFLDAVKNFDSEITTILLKM